MQSLQKIVAVFSGILVLLIVTIAIMLSIAVPTGPVYETELFDGYPPGLIVAGEKTDGTTVSEQLFPNMQLSARHLDGSAASLTLTPAGLTTFLIIADQLQDESPQDGYLDRPSAALDGGEIIIEFEIPTAISTLKLTRLSHNSDPKVTLYHGLKELGAPQPSDRFGRGNEQASYKLARNGSLTKIVIQFSGPGAVELIEYSTGITPIEKESWGTIKQFFGK